ncbi:hypothetical protein ACFVRD_27000 [Streptomyces sp. NPDC057908]|uniref:hypothetical protein n=1 Tax=Streptomyces sp. NPDC057908 TaxID=3346276 RepID=UPI0036E0F98B
MGSRSSLETLSSVVASASLAGTGIASVLYANPYEGVPFSPGALAGEAERLTRGLVAAPLMNDHLDDAAHQLGVCATACHYLASGIERSLSPAPSGSPAPARQQPGRVSAASPPPAHGIGARAPRR